MAGPISSFLLALLALAATPFTLLRILLFSRTSSHLKSSKCALVTGGRSQKALYITRALARSGYSVILAEETGWSTFCAARFSNSIHKIYSLPLGGGQAYIDALLQIAKSNRITLFLPCSGVATAIEEAAAARLMKKQIPSLVAIIQDADLLETLHEKDRFIDLVHSLGMDAPAGHLIKSPQEGLQLLRRTGNTRFLFKAATVPDDVGRSDMTTYPFLHADASVDWRGTEKRLETGMNIPICKQTPYLAQEFIGGMGATEWCTHATVIDGRITAFVCCPSNDMLMTYYNATHTAMGQRTRKWSEEFLDRLAEHPRWSKSDLTGHFSFDFIHQPESDRLVVIECNPRVHTAICLLRKDKKLGQAMDGTYTQSSPITPSLNVEPVSWLGHDLIARRWPLHHATDILSKAGVEDGAWEETDAWSYFGFYHVQWVGLLLVEAINLRRWSRINISTARVFLAK
ncbi:uncharacterized protein FA14DRAFT_151645 [Meira miltonrushii]|uniref:Carbamoyl phosphate synthase ATP-binding domain-containing protein n=1 Tax=Meira miltonrushii TaxID=1280837 RepID=A0A316V1B2_9BASI|nr:uncharacterized protein FA14DRAFT_151645 [Meira miltonrushii]PWN31339.1 hypothetical protein FA14DRAFT_151645 [Meira miltonrushii]